MLDHISSMNGGIYKTTEYCTCRMPPKQRDDSANAKFSAINKNTTQNKQKVKIVHNLTNKSNKEIQAWHLATFTSPEQLVKLQEEHAHELLLKKELDCFRVEVETKFRQSNVNKTYIFTKIAFDSERTASTDIAELNDVPNCNINK